MSFIPTKYPELNEILGGGVRMGSRVLVYGGTDIDIGIECEIVNGWSREMPLEDDKIQKCFIESINQDMLPPKLEQMYLSHIAIFTDGGIATVIKNNQTGIRNKSFVVEAYQV